MFWVVFNSALGIIAAAFITFKLSRYGAMLNLPERIGMAMMGGASILTLAVRWDIHNEGTPYTGWSTSWWLIGLIIYLGGRMSRHMRHERRNAEANEQARAHLVERGKL